jgi:tRNA(fMet)-specific endonuclease VapC
VSRVCIDTSAYSHFKRGDVEAVESISRARCVGVPAVVLGELRSGFLLGDIYERNERELAQFLRHPAVQVLDVDDEASRRHAEIVVSLRKAGTPVPTNVVWVAAVAVREGATVITYDSRFRLIHRVGCQVLR